MVTSVARSRPAGPATALSCRERCHRRGFMLGGKLAFILLLINVLRCYRREGSPPCICGPRHAGWVLTEQLRPVRAGALPGPGRLRAARRRLLHHTVITRGNTPATQLQPHWRQRADLTAGVRPRPAPPCPPALQPPSHVCGQGMGPSLSLRPLSSTGLEEVRQAAQAGEDADVPELPSLPLLPLLPKPPTACYAPTQSGEAPCAQFTVPKLPVQKLLVWQWF